MTLSRCPLSIFCSRGTPSREVSRVCGPYIGRDQCKLLDTLVVFQDAPLDVPFEAFGPFPSWRWPWLPPHPNGRKGLSINSRTRPLHANEENPTTRRGTSPEEAAARHLADNHQPAVWGQLVFSIALMCTTCRWILVSASTNQEPEPGDLILL